MALKTHEALMLRQFRISEQDFNLHVDALTDMLLRWVTAKDRQKSLFGIREFAASNGGNQALSLAISGYARACAHEFLGEGKDLQPLTDAFIHASVDRAWRNRDHDPLMEEVIAADARRYEVQDNYPNLEANNLGDTARELLHLRDQIQNHTGGPSLSFG